ncbi:hypothetical protein OSB04_007293 [Centaurea solstitialis]|uniref:Uncharacterized protein n=1 Tax=Centaurea solstitialis TaxID=347529 RepID=A0AA38U456_9ASTR|nr:hypothetical protein OSB04_007293 [Centaurea solstitialis]
MMEEGLLLTAEVRRRWAVVLAEEVKKTCYIALPLVVVTVSQNLLLVASVSMVGHLGELELAATAVATSLTNVTGFSLLVMPSFPKNFTQHLFKINFGYLGHV